MFQVIIYERHSKSGITGGGPHRHTQVPAAGNEIRPPEGTAENAEQSQGTFQVRPEESEAGEWPGL